MNWVAIIVVVIFIIQLVIAIGSYWRKDDRNK